MLGGILAGAMGGGAGAVNEMANAQLAQQSKIDMAKLENQLLMEREEASARRRQLMAREDQTYNTTGKGADEKLAFVKREATAATDAKVAERERTDPMDVKKAGDTQRAKEDAETAATTARGSDKGYLKAKQAETDAGQSSASKASMGESARGSRIANDQAAAIAKLRDRAEQMRARGDETGAKAIEDEILRRQNAKPGQEYDLEKIIEEEEDPATGTKTRRERTERRKPGGEQKPAAKPARLAVGAVVDGYRFLGGNPNDKSSWAPAAQSSSGKVK